MKKLMATIFSFLELRLLRSLAAFLRKGAIHTLLPCASDRFQIMAERTLWLSGIVGIYPAARVGEDVEVYADESR